MSDKSPPPGELKPASVLSGLPGAALINAMLFIRFVYLAQEMLEGGLARFDEAILMPFRTAGDAADPIGPPWGEKLERAAKVAAPVPPEPRTLTDLGALVVNLSWAGMLARYRRTAEA